jgi:hypothetical protein
MQKNGIPDPTRLVAGGFWHPRAGTHSRSDSPPQVRVRSYSKGGLFLTFNSILGSFASGTSLIDCGLAYGNPNLLAFSQISLAVSVYGTLSSCFSVAVYILD